MSTYLFSLSFPYCSSGWKLYIQSCSISSATRITVCLLIYSAFLDFLLTWMDTICPVISYFLCYSDHSVSTYIFPLSFTSCCSGWKLMSSHFLFPLLLGSQYVYLFISPFLYFLLFWMDTNVPSFSISSATRITECLLIYFPFPLLPVFWMESNVQSFSISPLLPVVLDGHYISSRFLFPLLL